MGFPESDAIGTDEFKIDQVVSAAKRALAAAPDGLRFVELIRALRQEGLDFPSLGTLIQWLPRRNPEIFSKPSRGLFTLTQNLSTSTRVDGDPGLHVDQGLRQSILEQSREQEFYNSFADFLMHDLDECTRALPVGGNAFGGKWGTPDVVGVSISRPRDIYKAPLEIVSAEVKVATGRELITAFGQACSYQLFSHKSYIVVPRSSKDLELDRLEALCQTFSIGLIVFDASNPEDPDYQIRVRAKRREPDRFYINETLTHKVFDDLLGFADL